MQAKSREILIKNLKKDANKKLSSEQAFKELVQLGIYTNAGKFTKKFTPSSS